VRFEVDNLKTGACLGTRSRGWARARLRYASERDRFELLYCHREGEVGANGSPRPQRSPLEKALRVSLQRRKSSGREHDFESKKMRKVEL